MNKLNIYFQKYETPLRFLLIGMGVLLILIGVFADFSWLKTIGDSYAADGDCYYCKTFVDFSLIIFSVSGIFLIIYALKFFPISLRGSNDLETILEFALFFVLGLYLVSSQTRCLDNDAYEHLHNAWLMTEGKLPYFDLSAQHLPLLEWIIVIFMRFTGESTLIIQLMRLFMFVISCGSLYLIYKITEELFNSKTKALLALFLIVSNLVWIVISYEIRPDNIMIFFALLSFWFLMKYYKYQKSIYLIIFVLCAFFSMMGKQNAAVFYLAIGIVFAYDISVRKRLLNLKIIAILLTTVIILLQIDVIKDFITINVNRHLIPNHIKFWPNNLLEKIYISNPALFLLFIFQLFSPIKLNEKYEIIPKYLITISLVCFTFLFLMNRPFMQEMLVMVVFMGMFSANIFAEIIQKVDRKVVHVIIVLLILPVLLSTKRAVFEKSISDDIKTTKNILEIARRDDLVFDTYGKAIFRHHPLDPEYLIYFPDRFKRFGELKSSRVKFLIKDRVYYPRLPKDVLNWFKKNFRQTHQNPNIYIRIDHEVS